MRTLNQNQELNNVPTPRHPREELALVKTGAGIQCTSEAARIATIVETIPTISGSMFLIVRQIRK